MKLCEFTTIKPIKPLTPADTKIDALKQQKTRATTALKTERDHQKQAKALAGVQKAQQTLSKARSII